MHLPASYRLTCIDKFMYMRAGFASSIIQFTHSFTHISVHAAQLFQSFEDVSVHVCLFRFIIFRTYHCMHAIHPEALSHCGHGHDLTSVGQLSVINIAHITSAFDKHWLSPKRCQWETIAEKPAKGRLIC